MKITMYVCNGCGTIMQSDELPVGWKKLPGLDITRPEKHQCKSCIANSLTKRDLLEELNRDWKEHIEDENTTGFVGMSDVPQEEW